jgi:hypothetical protein
MTKCTFFIWQKAYRVDFAEKVARPGFVPERRRGAAFGQFVNIQGGLGTLEARPKREKLADS